MKTILELADDYAKAYLMGRGEDARKLLQAAIINAEVAAIPVIYIDNEGKLHSRVSPEQVETVLGPYVDKLRSYNSK
jgi:hypothetical protein